MTEKLKIESFPIGPLSCNCSIIYSPLTKEAIAIDPGQDASLFLKHVNKLGVTIKKLLHTHAHFDHIGDSSYLRGKLGCQICLHKDDEFLYQALPEQGQFFGFQLQRPGPLDIYIQDEHEFGLEESALKDASLNKFLKALHTPGHTPGSVSFYTEIFDTPLLFAGDTLFYQSIGRTDLPGGDSRRILKSIKERLLSLPDETQVITGHGPSTFIFQEKRSNPFL